MPADATHEVRYQDGSLAPFDRHRLEASLLAAAQATRVELTWDRTQGLIAEAMARLERDHRACTPLLPGMEGAFPSPNGFWETRDIADTIASILLEQNEVAVAQSYLGHQAAERPASTPDSQPAQAESTSRRQPLPVASSGQSAPAQEGQGPFTFNALTVLRKRYLRKDNEGSVIETAEGMLRRVAHTVAAADAEFSGADVATTEEVFYKLMVDLDFLPNSPTLMNAGRPHGQMSACFVLPVEDSIASIFEAVKQAALVQQTGGGVGYSFSHLRPAGDIVKSTKGIASGPLSFMKVFDSATEAIKQGGTRRGAQMAILRVDHPDILAFVAAKETEGSFANFNFSVGITDAFMSALHAEGDLDLVNPHSGEVTRRLPATEVFDRIVRGAWHNGEPGIVFIDRMNAFSPTPALGVIESTNPCGEQPLLANESCNLGSINLANMVASRTGDRSTAAAIDWGRLEATVRAATHFLDNVICSNHFPLPQIAEATLRTRKIGLGVMGFADLLCELGVPYDSDEAIALTERVMAAISYWSKDESCNLASARGSFPAFNQSIYASSRFALPLESTWPNPNDDSRLDWPNLRERVAVGLRNATTTTIAPTGTISIIAGASSGIEPIFALSYVRRNLLDAGDELVEVNPAFERVAKERGFYSDDLMRRIAETGSVQNMAEVPDDVRRVFVTAHDISPDSHVRLQAAAQRYVDNAVSKTVNFPQTATEDDVRRAYLMAYELGCKGITVYRDGSRQSQVLNIDGHKQCVSPSEEFAAPGSRPPSAQERSRAASVPKEPRRRPSVTSGQTEKVTTGCGSLYITINEDENGLCEVFLRMGKSGGCLASQSEAVGRLISLALRSGIDINSIFRQLRGIRCPQPAWGKGGMILSCSDAIGQVLERHLNHVPPPVLLEPTVAKAPAAIAGDDLAGMCPECPECGSLLAMSEGCVVCRSCGYSKCW
jgi:ribonucleoside-diphosphate reductase alpha chain